MRAWRAGIVALLITPVVAQAGVRNVSSLEGAATGDRVKIEGVLSTRGSTPFVIHVLEMPDHAEITLKAHDGDIETQLRSLDGLQVSLEGDVAVRLDPTIPRLDVYRCDLVSPPGGGDPVNGMLTVEDGACIFTTGDNKRYWLVGDLAPALCQHSGARVWIVGKKTKHAGGIKPRESTAFTPTGYGVIE